MMACFCGRSEELEDRRLVVDDAGKEALMCPRCGRTDDLGWLSGDVRRVIFAQARRRVRESKEVGIAA